MSRRPQLSRQVPSESVSKFDDWCERQGHVNGGDKGRHAEQAILEYLPPTYRPERFRDDLDGLEADLRADLDEAGCLSDGSSLNETPVSRTDDETVKLTYRIAEDVQDALEQYVYDQEGKVRGVMGEYVATALDEYRDGGQVARVRRYYEQLRESVDMISEDRVELIVETLRDKVADRDRYHIEEIRIAVNKALDVHSDDVRNDFVDRVIEHLGFVSVKTAEGLYATPDRAEQLVQQHEVDADTDWSMMDREDRVEYLTKAVKARSRQGGKGAGVDYNQVRDEVFNGHPSNEYCYKLMGLAGEYPGFDYGEHNGKLMLRCTGSEETLNSQPEDDWVSEATNLLQDFCDSSGMVPTEIPQPVIDKQVVQAKYPEEYTEYVGEYVENAGPSERALKAITEEDRNLVRNRLIDDETQVEAEVKKEMDRITVESEPVTDGGQTYE